MMNWFARNFDLTAFAIVLLIVGVGFAFSGEFLGLASSSVHNYETIGHYVFNNPLVLAALLGFPILIKRLSVMQEQVEKSQQQIEIGQKQTRANQYSVANELLWSEHLGARIAGIEILWQQLQDNPDERTQRQIMILFSEFVKNPPYGSGERDDVSLILKLTRES